MVLLILMPTSEEAESTPVLILPTMKIMLSLTKFWAYHFPSFVASVASVSLHVSSLRYVWVPISIVLGRALAAAAVAIFFVRLVDIFAQVLVWAD